MIHVCLKQYLYQLRYLAGYRRGQGKFAYLLSVTTGVFGRGLSVISQKKNRFDQMLYEKAT